jgi:hypothetical protein
MGELSMAEKNKWVDAIAKMIELTQNGKLTWCAKKPSDSMAEEPDDRIGTVFEAYYNKRRLWLYERTRKMRIPPDYPLPDMSPGDEYWASQIILQFVDPSGQPLWTFPRLSVLSDLLGATQYQVAGVKDFLDSILSEDSDDF